MPEVHAILSASSSKRWLNCTPSARLEQNFPNESSVYAEEGTAAHALGEYSQRILCSGRHRMVCRSGRINWPAILLGRKRPGDMVGLHIGPIYTTDFAVPCVNGRT